MVPDRFPHTAFVPKPTASKGKGATARRAADPSLNTFENVMDAMDAKVKGVPSAATRSAAPGPASRAAYVDSDDEMASDADSDSDVELSAQDQELMQKLISSGTNLSDLAAGGDTPALQLNMIQNFLESYKAQGGTAGPVSTLAGRMEVGPLPEDRR